MSDVIPFDPNRRRKTQPAKPATSHPGQPTPVEVCDTLEPGRISQARGMRGWTRRELGDAVGVTAATVGHWEFGSWKVRPHQLTKLAEVCDVPIGFFARGRPMARIDSSEVFICSVGYEAQPFGFDPAEGANP